MRGIIIKDRYGNLIDITDPRPRQEIVNELMISRDDAVARCGITGKQFDALVKEGIFVGPVQRSRKWNRKALYQCFEARSLKRVKVESGYVYFMEMGDFIKIGWSTWPASRRDSLQTGNPYDIKILGAFPSTPATEDGLHALFAHARRRGEWFRKTPGLLAYIAWLKVVWRGDARVVRGDLDNVITLPIGEKTGNAKL